MDFLLICDAHLQLIKEMKEQAELLGREHSIIEKEIVDIYHYIELVCDSDSSLLKASILLKDCLIRRRAVKENLTLIGRFLDVKPANAKYKTFHSLERAKYSPRILKELFKSERK